MVSFKSYLFQVSILVVLLCMTPSNARPNVKVSGDIINTLCSKTSFASYCLELLQSIPGTTTADIKGLAKITLDLALSNANETLYQLHSLILKTSDPELKKSYESCFKHYDGAINYLKYSEINFNQGQYYGMNLHASAAMIETADCDDETENVAADPSIKKATQILDQIISIVLIASNLLHFSVYPTN